jgi:spore coat polysaccharide biosynthesis protein SpsF
MLRNLGIVQACFDSDVARTAAARRLGGKPVLEWIVRRVTDCERLDGVIVLTSDAPENAFVAELAPRDVPVWAAPQPDALARFVAAVERFPAEAVVRVRVDYPFLDPMLIDRLVTTADTHPTCDYVGYCLHDGRPAILSPVGMYTEWIRATALRRANRKAVAAADRDDVTGYVYSHPEKFNLRLIPAPSRMDRDDVRLTVDMEDDWEHALAIYDALGSEELNWQRIADLLDHQPAMRSHMAHLNRVHAKY